MDSGARQAGGDYRAFFGRVRDLERLQTRPEQVTWLERSSAPARTCDTVLYLGCNILRTPHVAREVIRVFGALGEDFVAVAGVQFCCGIPWAQAGDGQEARKVGTRALAKVGGYRPSTLVLWCPSCDVHFADAVLAERERPLPFAVVSAAQYLARRAEQGRFAWSREVPARVALHAHEGRAEHASGRRRALDDRGAVTRLLAAVPGVEPRAVVSAPELDYDCGVASLRLPRARFLAVRDGLVEDARAQGADVVATVSHACQREWCDAGGIAVRNYTALVADALGLEPEEDLLRRYKCAGDPEAVLRESEDFWRSHGLGEPEARQLVQRYFGRSAPMSP